MAHNRSSSFFDDVTRQKILPHLMYTGTIIDALFESLALDYDRTIVEPQEDLGLANNIVRMRGGFYTGCFIKWNCSVPFIPVDTTVNACGVSVFRLFDNYSAEAFKEKCEKVINRYDADDFNFIRGNHFISLCFDDLGTDYLVVHASDNSFKYGSQGLYPYRNSWYIPYIKTFVQGDRFLRYIIGGPAERFYDIYKKAEYSNPIRNCALCTLMFGDNNWEEVLYSPHYGMPDNKSVAIGCQWKTGEKIILTTPKNDLFIIKSNASTMFPHGFGMIKEDLKTIRYSFGDLFINDHKLEHSDSYIIDGQLHNRFSNIKITEMFLRSFLCDKQFEISSVLHQKASWNRNGFQIYNY